jgi:hypothetical protein
MVYAGDSGGDSFGVGWEERVKRWKRGFLRLAFAMKGVHIRALQELLGNKILAMTSGIPICNRNSCRMR